MFEQELDEVAIKVHSLQLQHRVSTQNAREAAIALLQCSVCYLATCKLIKLFSGYGEAIRLLLAYKNIEYEDVRYEHGSFPKANFKFGRVPGLLIYS